jgi:hypothetical protein
MKTWQIPLLAFECVEDEIDVTHFHTLDQDYISTCIF